MERKIKFLLKNYDFVSLCSLNFYRFVSYALNYIEIEIIQMK